MKNFNLYQWMKYASFAILSVCLTIFVACQKDIVNAPVAEIENSSTTKPSDQATTNLEKARALYPTIKKGRLAFANQAAFTAYMDVITKLQVEDVEQLNKEKGFISHYTASQQERNEQNSAQFGDDKSDSPKWVIPDVDFAATLNDEREVAVGEGIICRAGNDFSFLYKEGNSYLIENFYRDYESGSVSVPEEGLDYADGSLYVYQTGMVSLDNGGKAQVRDAILGYSKLSRGHVSFDGTWRLFGEHWRGSWIVYASTGVMTGCQKVACILWGRVCWYEYKNATQLGMNFNSQYTSPPSPTIVPWTGSVAENNVRRIDRTFQFVTGTFEFGAKFKVKPAKLDLKLKQGSSVHTGTLNGVSRSFTLQW